LSYRLKSFASAPQEIGIGTALSVLTLMLMRQIDQQFRETPFFGVRQMIWHLRNEGHLVNEKRIRRLMRLMGLMPIYQKPKTSKAAKGRKTYPYLLRGLKVTRPNQVWTVGIAYLPMRRGFLYLVATNDWYRRKVLAWRISNTLLSDFWTEAIARFALQIHQYRAKQEACSDGSVWEKAHGQFIGVRLRKATEAEWPSINLSDRFIDNYNFKTKKEVFVPICDRLHEVLSKRHNQAKPFMSMDRAIKNLRMAISECCPSSPRVLATQGKVTIHSCRDTYATRMLNQGLRLEEVCHLLGHATVVQTQKYAKFAKRDVADKAREILNSAQKEV
jgi:integrase